MNVANNPHPPDPERAFTLLFVPGTHPERFSKAISSGADLVVLDLEDSVAPVEKDRARENVRAWLAEGHHAAVRVNGAGTPWHAEDLAAVRNRTVALVVPKAEPGPALASLAAEGVAILALVETAAGIIGAREVAATPGVQRLLLGSFDLAAELGIDPTDSLALAAARSALVLSSAAEGLAGPVDGVRADLDDETGLWEEALLARRLGFTGKLLVHPRQVARVAAALRPTDTELEWARNILAATAEGTGGVVTHDGQMVDKPVVDRARRLLANEDKTSGREPERMNDVQ